MSQKGAVRLFAEERQNKIAELLRENGKLEVPQLCDMFEKSPATIRNDLNDMAAQGLLQRTHGGAIPLSKTGFEPNSAQKIRKNSAEKEAIARKAINLVDDGDTIAIDTGTTMLAFAEVLTCKKNLTVITNDIKIAAFLDENTDFTVILTGGILRKGFNCMVGAMTTQSLHQFRVDRTFLATNGLSVGAGLTTPDMGQAEVKRVMSEIGSQVIVLSDSHKIGTDSFSTVISLDKVSVIVTDNGISEEEAFSLQKIGVEIITAEI